MTKKLKYGLTILGSLFAISSVATTSFILSSCSETSQNNSDLSNTYQKDYLHNSSVALSSNVKAVDPQGIIRNYCSFSIDDQSSPWYGMFFIVIENNIDNEIYAGFFGFEDFYAAQNAKWDGHVPDVIQIPNTWKLTYNSNKITELPVKAIGDFMSNLGGVYEIIQDKNNRLIPHGDGTWNYYHGLKVPATFDVSNNLNLEFLFNYELTYYSDSALNLNQITLKLPKNMKYVLQLVIGYTLPTLSQFPKFIVDFSNCSNLVELFGEVSSINLTEVKLNKNIVRLSKPILNLFFQNNSCSPSTDPLIINLENVRFINYDVFTETFFPNNTVTLNKNCEYYFNALNGAGECYNSFNTQTTVIGGKKLVEIVTLT